MVDVVVFLGELFHVIDVSAVSDQWRIFVNLVSCCVTVHHLHSMVLSRVQNENTSRWKIGSTCALNFIRSTILPAIVHRSQSNYR